MMSIHNQTPSLGRGTLQEPGSKGVGTPEHMLQHRHMLSQAQLCRWGELRPTCKLHALVPVQEKSQYPIDMQKLSFQIHKGRRKNGMLSLDAEISTKFQSPSKSSTQQYHILITNKCN